MSLRSLSAPLFFLLTSIWLAALLAAPWLSAGRLAHRSLLPGVVAVYGAAGLLCHQRVDRTFHVAAAPMPVCARCLGLYAAAPFGALLALAWRSPRGRLDAVSARVRANARMVLLASAIPTAATVVMEEVIADPGNVTRAVAALPLGATIALIVGATLAGWLDATAHDARPRSAPASA